jgi:predicted PurR-regulated permease PerM
MDRQHPCVQDDSNRGEKNMNNNHTSTSLKTESPGIRNLSSIFFLICFALILYAFYRIFIPYMVPLAWALILSSVFFPLYRRLNARLGERSSLSALLMVILISVLIILPILWMILLLAGQSIDAYHRVDKTLKSGFDLNLYLQKSSALTDLWTFINSWVRLDSVDWKAALLQAMNVISSFLVNQSTSLLGQLAGFLFDFLIMLTAMYYFFKDGSWIVASLKELDPLPVEYEELLILQFLEVSQATLYGNLMTALCQGIAGGILFWVLGIPSALLWGALMGFLSLLPAVGSFLVWMPAGVFQLLAGEPWKGVVILVFGLTVVSSLDNVLKPFFIRGKADMHTLLVFLSAFGGIQVFGFLGLVLGPLVCALFLTFLQLYKIEFQSGLKRKITPPTNSPCPEGETPVPVPAEGSATAGKSPG